VGFWHGKTANCFWFYHSGDNREWNEFVAATRSAFITATPGDLFLNIPYRNEAPDAKMRKDIADVIRNEPRARRISHHAFVTDSTLIYGVNVAISWAAQKPWKEESFMSPQPAFEWLARVSPKFDAERTRRDIAAAVPRSAAWRPFFDV
jgi:hypothetical protein